MDNQIGDTAAVIAIGLPLAVALVGFAALWPLSVWRKDASLVDFAWAPGFAVQALIAALVLIETHTRAGLILLLVFAWSGRLGFVLIRRRLREGLEDARYTAIRDSWGPSFWWKSLFLVFILQAILQWLISLGPIAGILSADTPLGVLAGVGVLIAIAGFVLETLADQELDQFKKSAAHHSLLTSGLRSRMRHPNYTGEIAFWTGIALICLEAGAWGGLISPILITFFLVKVSGAPMLDEHMAATRPDYAAYKKRVPAFLPKLRCARTTQ